jgi:hypothetical protein
MSVLSSVMSFFMPKEGHTPTFGVDVTPRVIPDPKINAERVVICSDFLNPVTPSPPDWKSRYIRITNTEAAIYGVQPGTTGYGKKLESLLQEKGICCCHMKGLQPRRYGRKFEDNEGSFSFTGNGCWIEQMIEIKGVKVWNYDEADSH